MAADEMQQILDAILHPILDTTYAESRDLQGNTDMYWPHLVPMMHMHAKAYIVPSYGSIFALQTDAMHGAMKLATIVCTPCSGGRVPVLLIDVMKMKKKQAVFVEYYDCTAQGCDASLLNKTAEKYASLPAYEEKPAWYIKERMPASLIKTGENWQQLTAMAVDSMSVYAQMIVADRPDVFAAANKKKLSAFIERMVKEGNPSSSTMVRVLGKEKAEEFFRTVIMPKEIPTEGEKI